VTVDADAWLITSGYRTLNRGLPVRLAGIAAPTSGHCLSRRAWEPAPIECVRELHLGRPQRIGMTALVHPPGWGRFRSDGGLPFAEQRKAVGELYLFCLQLF
jgi:hypothetical protein